MLKFLVRPLGGAVLLALLLGGYPCRGPTFFPNDPALTQFGACVTLAKDFSEITVLGGQHAATV
jgi:hypothetical protein